MTGNSDTPAPTSAVDGEVVKAIKKQIILAMQLHDFGHNGTSGQFHTNAPKIALLEECAEKAAIAIAALKAPAVPAAMGGAGELVDRLRDIKAHLRQLPLIEVNGKMINPVCDTIDEAIAALAG